MKISELIKKLEEMKIAHGDVVVNVVTGDRREGGFDELEERDVEHVDGSVNIGNLR